MNFSQPSILLLGGFLKEEEFTKSAKQISKIEAI